MRSHATACSTRSGSDQNIFETEVGSRGILNQKKTPGHQEVWTKKEDTCLLN